MHDDVQTTGWDRAGIAAVILLLAAFVLGAMTPLATTAGADDSVSATRDDDSRELVGVEDDDDDDDGTDGGAGTNGGSNGSLEGDTRSDSNSGEPSIGTNSANTKTGSTRGTGVSKSVSNSSGKSKNTKTGTTRGTGKSKSVSNSS